MEKDFNLSEQARKHFRQIRSAFQANKDISPETWGNLEKGLLAADVGPQASGWLRERLQSLAELGHIHSGEQAYLALHQELIQMLGKPSGLHHSEQPSIMVIMVMGNHGSGITTTAAQLSYHLNKIGKKVLLISKSLFRATKKDILTKQVQLSSVLTVWPDNDADSLDVIKTMLQPNRIQGFDVVVIDSSDYLMTNSNDFGDLKRSIHLARELLPFASFELIGAFDASSGLMPLHHFRDIITSTELTGIIISKVEMSTKVGCIFAVADDLGVPIKFVGVNKEIEGLVPFDPTSFVTTLFE